MRPALFLRVLPLSAAAFLAACATSYQPDGFSGGYSDMKLGENVWQVDFRGNGYTSSARARDFSLLRAAEITTAVKQPPN